MDMNVYFELFKGLLLYPSKFFHEITGYYTKAIYTTFGLSCIVVFIKSFSKEIIYNSFFENTSVNNIISLLNIPQVQWCMSLLGFILFIIILINTSNCQQKKNNKDLILCILSISSMGLLSHIVFFVIHFIFSAEIIHFLIIVIYLWFFCLNVLAIKEVRCISYLNSFFLFIISGFPSVLLVGLPGLAPYSLWLST